VVEAVVEIMVLLPQKQEVAVVEAVRAVEAAQMALLVTLHLLLRRKVTMGAMAQVLLPRMVLEVVEEHLLQGQMELVLLEVLAVTVLSLVFLVHR
jgi:hypothetical protein